MRCILRQTRNINIYFFTRLLFIFLIVLIIDVYVTNTYQSYKLRKLLFTVLLQCLTCQLFRTVKHQIYNIKSYIWLEAYFIVTYSCALILFIVKRVDLFNIIVLLLDVLFVHIYKINAFHDSCLMTIYYKYANILKKIFTVQWEIQLIV